MATELGEAYVSLTGDTRKLTQQIEKDTEKAVAAGVRKGLATAHREQSRGSTAAGGFGSSLSPAELQQFRANQSRRNAERYRGARQGSMNPTGESFADRQARQRTEAARQQAAQAEAALARQRARSERAQESQARRSGSSTPRRTPNAPTGAAGGFARAAGGGRGLGSLASATGRAGPWGAAATAVVSVAAVGISEYKAEVERARQANIRFTASQGAVTQSIRSTISELNKSRGFLSQGALNASAGLNAKTLAQLKNTAAQSGSLGNRISDTAFGWMPKGVASALSFLGAEKFQKSRDIRTNAARIPEVLEKVAGQFGTDISGLQKTVTAGGLDAQTILSTLRGLGPDGIDGAKILEDTAKQTKELAKQWRESTPGVQTLADAYQTLASRTGDAQTRTNAFLSVMDSFTNRNREAESAVRSLADAQRNINELVRTGVDTRDGMGASLVDAQGNINQFLANGALLTDRLNDIQAAAASLFAQGQNPMAAWDSNIGRLAEVFQLTPEQVEALKGRFQGSVGDLKVGVELMTDGAEGVDAQMKAYQRAIENHGAVKIPADLVLGEPGDALRKALAQAGIPATTAGTPTTGGSRHFSRSGTFAAGGGVFGPGGPTSDSVPALLSAGEHVWTAAEVNAAGGHERVKALRDAAKAGALKFAGGGAVPKYVPMLIRKGNAMGATPDEITAAIAANGVEAAYLNAGSWKFPESQQWADKMYPGDHDSLGIFQMRMSVWGNQYGGVAGLMNPENQASWFYSQSKAFKGQSPGEIAANVENPAAQYRGKYAAKVNEANAFYAAAFGGATEAKPAAAAVVFPVTGGTITSDYKSPDRPNHRGVDIGASMGTPILAAAAGTVSKAGPAQGFGNWVVISHGGYDTVYGHMEADSITVKPGDKVSAGQQIAAVGSAGESTGPHLHFEVWQGGRDSGGEINPTSWLNASGASAGGAVGTYGYGDASAYQSGQNIYPGMADYSGIQGDYTGTMASVYGSGTLGQWTDDDEARLVAAYRAQRDADFALSEEARNSGGIDHASKMAKLQDAKESADRAVQALEAEKGYKRSGGLAPQVAPGKRMGRAQRAKAQAYAQLTAANQNRNRMHALYKQGLVTAADVYAADAAYEDAMDAYRFAGRGNLGNMLGDYAADMIQTGSSSAFDMVLPADSGLGKLANRGVGIGQAFASAFGADALDIKNPATWLQGGDQFALGVEDAFGLGQWQDPDAMLAQQYGYTPNAMQEMATQATVGAVPPAAGGLTAADWERIEQFTSNRPNVTFQVDNVGQAMNKLEVHQKRAALSYGLR